MLRDQVLWDFQPTIIDPVFNLPQSISSEFPRLIDNEEKSYEVTKFFFGSEAAIRDPGWLSSAMELICELP